MKVCFWAFVCFLLIVDQVVSPVLAQQNQRNNNKNKKKQTKKPVGGKWRPTVVRNGGNNQRRPAPTTKTGNRAVSSQNNQRRNQLFDDIVRPPLQRYEGEAPLQKPSWTHCLHGITVDSNWASVTSPNYPSPISGQMQCTWVFTGTRGKRLRISFNDIDLQPQQGGRCGSQFVDVIDLALLKSQGRFCGNDVPGDYVSTGHQIRLDIQGDTTLVPHKGFQAAVRVEDLSLQPGLRRRSLMYDGPLTTTTQAPIRTTRRRLPTTKRTTTSTASYSLTRDPGVYYGNHQQPNINIKIANDGNNNSPATETIALYVFIALFCLCVLLSGIGFVFRKPLYAKYKKFKNKNKSAKPLKEEDKSDDEKKKSDSSVKEEQDATSQEDRAFCHGRFELPGGADGTPTLGGRRRRSVMFEDEVLAGLDTDSLPRNTSSASNKSDDDIVRNDRESDICRSEKSLSKAAPADSDLHFQGWNYPHSEPIYEVDTMSVQSYSSARSASRHPDHETYKHKKIMEQNNAMFYDHEIYAPHSEPVYASHANVQPLFHLGVPTVSQYAMGPSYPGPPVMPPQYDPASAYMMGQHPAGNYNGYNMQYMPRHDLGSHYDPTPDYARGRSLPPSYSERDTYDVEQRRITAEPTVQDEGLIEKQQRKGTVMMQDLCGMRPSKSLGDLTLAASDVAINEAQRVSSQSIADLPVETNFLRRQVERRQSFSI
ncbi:uncharacterized protein LOC143460388 [Clavelina lepadiformis]|uniref:uncharacterized protein LOC143460388 n=1 Tax=Clavelina lepadiformis TaxID=159417 RepID=UPI004041C2A7